MGRQLVSRKTGDATSCACVCPPSLRLWLGAGKPRGYAFVEFEHKNDMKQAYKMADGRKIEDKRVLVDVERGRTVPNWRAWLVLRMLRRVAVAGSSWGVGNQKGWAHMRMRVPLIEMP